MSDRQEKINILKKNGYVYHFSRMIYINKAAKKIFSVEFIDDNGIQTIKNKINEKNTNEYQFYFSYELEKDIKKSIEAELDS